jgi:hypothetical protein
MRMVARPVGQWERRDRSEYWDNGWDDWVRELLLALDTVLLPDARAHG